MQRAELQCVGLGFYGGKNNSNPWLWKMRAISEGLSDCTPANFILRSTVANLIALKTHNTRVVSYMFL